MREELWNLYQDFKIAEYYYQYYSVRAARQRQFISAICVVASTAFAATWIKTGTLALLWSILIFVAQLFSALQPLLPYDKRLASSQHIQREVSRLVLNVASIWRQLSIEDCNMSELEIEHHITDFMNTYQDIEETYAVSSTFPPNKRLHRKAEASAELFLGRYLHESVRAQCAEST